MMTNETMLNDLPILVTGPGIYIMRNGGRMQVSEVTDHSHDGTTPFVVKGHVEKTFRGKMAWGDYNIWHRSGRCSVLGERGRDIVAKE